MNWKVGDTCHWPSSGRIKSGRVAVVTPKELEIDCGGRTYAVDVKVCCKSEDMARELMAAFRSAPGPRKYHPPYRGKR